MKDKAAENEFLQMGLDDWTGLWETWWLLQTDSPELRGKPAIEAARRVLRGLVSRDLVYLGVFDENSNDERRLTSQEALALMDTEGTWQPPNSPRDQLRFATTEKGEKHLRRHRSVVGATPQ
jgi:hypothetical protein